MRASRRNPESKPELKKKLDGRSAKAPLAKPEKAARAIGEVRIIGGSLKRSKLDILDRPGLRPTPDRVRETLFNWLAPHLEGARVLDLCAGTGVLGLEAVSRGAATVLLNDADAALTHKIAADATRLKVAERVRTSTRRGEALLNETPNERFDVVFVDPPFDAALWTRLLFRLPGWLAPNALVYLEHPRGIAAPFTDPWKIHRQAHAGSIAFYLLTRDPDSLFYPDSSEPAR